MPEAPGLQSGTDTSFCMRSKNFKDFCLQTTQVCCYAKDLSSTDEFNPQAIFYDHSSDLEKTPLVGQGVREKFASWRCAYITCLTSIQKKSPLRKDQYSFETGSLSANQLT